MNLKKILFTIGCILAVIFLPAMLVEIISPDLYRQFGRDGYIMRDALQLLNLAFVVVIVVFTARFLKIELGSGFWTWILGMGMAMLVSFGFAAFNISVRQNYLAMGIAGIFALIGLAGFVMFIIDAFRPSPTPVSFERGITTGESSQVSPDELQAVVAKIRGLA